MSKLLMKCQVYNKGIFTNLGYFFIIRNIRMCRWLWVKWRNWFHCIMFGSFTNARKSSFQWPHTQQSHSATTVFKKLQIQVCLYCGAWSIFQVFESMFKQLYLCKWLKKTADSACAWSTELRAWTHKQECKYFHNITFISSER